MGTCTLGESRRGDSGEHKQTGRARKGKKRWVWIQDKGRYSVLYMVVQFANRREGMLPVHWAGHTPYAEHSTVRVLLPVPAIQIWVRIVCVRAFLVALCETRKRHSRKKKQKTGNTGWARGSVKGDEQMPQSGLI